MMIANLEWGNLDILTPGVMYIGPVSGLFQVPYWQEKEGSTWRSMAATSSLTLTKQCVQTTQCKMAEIHGVGHHGWKCPEYGEGFVLEGKCPPCEQSLFKKMESVSFLTSPASCFFPHSKFE